MVHGSGEVKKAFGSTSTEDVLGMEMKMCESIAQGGIQKHEESGDLEGKGERAEGRRHRKRGCWMLLPPDADLFELNKYVKRILVFWYIFKTFYF